MTISKNQLDCLVNEANTDFELYSYADPLQVVKKFQKDKNLEYIALICALFAYGNAKNIVSFLKKLDFSLLDSTEEYILKGTKNLKYRFQNEKDIAQIFIVLRRIKQETTLNDFFTQNYKQEQNVTQALQQFIKRVYKNNSYRSHGYEFFFGKPFDREPSSPLKRYNLFLRWMVRKDELDLGIFTQIYTKDLLVPLDTHMHQIALKYNFLQRKSYDFKAVIELTNTFKKFDSEDPVKYDFALYRLGQKMG